MNMRVLYGYLAALAVCTIAGSLPFLYMALSVAVGIPTTVPLIDSAGPWNGPFLFLMSCFYCFFFASFGHFLLGCWLWADCMKKRLFVQASLVQVAGFACIVYQGKFFAGLCLLLFGFWD